MPSSRVLTSCRAFHEREWAACPLRDLFVRARLSGGGLPLCTRGQGCCIAGRPCVPPQLGVALPMAHAGEGTGAAGPRLGTPLGPNPASIAAVAAAAGASGAGQRHVPQQQASAKGLRDSAVDTSSSSSSESSSSESSSSESSDDGECRHGSWQWGCMHAQHNAAQHSTAQRSRAQRSAALHDTVWHGAARHVMALGALADVDHAVTTQTRCLPSKQTRRQTRTFPSALTVRGGATSCTLWLLCAVGEACCAFVRCLDVGRRFWADS